MKAKVASIVRVTAVCLFAGCGGGDSSGEGDAADPVSSAEAAQVCSDFSDHATQCGWGGNINGADWNCGDASVVWRADVFRTVAECAIELDCEGSGVTCLQLAFDVDPLPIHEQYATECADQRDACSLTSDSDTSAFLLGCRSDALAAYAGPIMEAILSCLSESCDAIVPCLDDVL